MESKQFHFRIRSVLVVLLTAFLGFTWVLYDLQIVNGQEFRERSQRKIANTEVVEAARGEILDRYGRRLVTNRTSYDVRLDTALMGKNLNDILHRLLVICREQGVAWSDSLPVSAAAPFVYTGEEAGDIAWSRFLKLLEKEDGWAQAAPPRAELEAMRPPEPDENGVTPPWTSPGPRSADGLLMKMRETLGVDPELSDQEARDLLGVLYELRLRAKAGVTVEYVFAEITQEENIDFITAVKEAHLTGVRFDASSVRVYRTTYAAHLLGRVGLMNAAEQEKYIPLGYAGDERVGKDGVEQAFESYLHGVEGKRNIETNTEGKVVSSPDDWVVDPNTGQEERPQPGNHVLLTLDLSLQEKVERSLAQRIPELPSQNTEGGAAVVLDVSDGSVLALASYPTYDLSQYSSAFNELSADPLKPLFNRATQGLYPPGSTFKMVVAAGALQELAGEGFTTKSKVLCTGRYKYYKNIADQPMCWIYRQFRGTHGPQNVTQAIQHSCNIFFYDTGRRLGIDMLDQYAKMFGLGEKTGIEVYEEKGHAAGPEYTESLGETWFEGNVMSAAIGQEKNQFTPLQLANYIATLVNGGTHYSVHLLNTVKSSDYSQVVYRREPEVVDDFQIAPENLEAIKEGMYLAAQDNKYLKGLDIKVGAKTGSAQVSSATESNAVFVCFAPYDAPEIAIAIVVEKGGSGAELGAIAADIVEYYFSANHNMAAAQRENTLIQ